MTLTQRIASKLYRESKYLRRDIAHLSGFDEKFYRNARGSRILIYHGICLADHTRFNPIFLKLKTFEQHLQFCQKYFNVVSLDDYYLGNFSDEKFNVCMTFDDGYANNHKYVLSLLKKYQLPATFFVTAIRDAGHDILWNDFLGIIGKYGPKEISYKGELFWKGLFNRYISQKSGKNLADILRSGGFDVKAEMMELLYPLVPFRESKPNDADYWLQMTTEQIRELSASSLVTIGSHGYYHNDLARIPVQDAASEMRHSKQFLENIVDKPVSSFAFPYGTYTRRTVDEAKNAGYNQLLAMDFQFAEDQQDLTMRERFTVNPFISPANQMHATITRSYD
ncbi:MAG TPA: polysaccharide deacetylase family protein [Mucilaginibacter sp.]|jgi:peptidoglycan/xylan/chitin deacetylase (PgdA/CDA1 family)|nr:polysaccharide deacetylase family protein [Mucilaginibacter sp.]